MTQETFEQIAFRVLKEIEPETKRLPPGFLQFATRLRDELAKDEQRIIPTVWLHGVDGVKLSALWWDEENPNLLHIQAAMQGKESGNG